MSSDHIAVLTPLACIVLMASVFWLFLSRRDGRAPIFEIGSWKMLGIVAYGALPLVWYLLSGMEFTPLSHGRLYLLNPSPEQYGAIGWLYVLYQAAFGAAYLMSRSGARAPLGAPLHVDGQSIVALVLLFLGLRGAIFVVNSFYGVNFFTAYDSSLYDSFEAYSAMPLVARQLIDWTYAALVIVNCALVIVLMSRWQSRLARTLLAAGMVIACLEYLANPGSRFVLLSVLLAMVLGYHRFVRPLQVINLTMTGALVAVMFFAAGFLRGSATLEEAVDSIAFEDGVQLFFSISNEFQISYGSIIEIKQFLEERTLAAPPWEFYASEPLMAVPSQLLPFEKIEPSKWYTDETQNPDFLTYGVIAQSLMGLGYLEIVLRGVAIGLLLALLHNHWARKPTALWTNVLYVWLSIMIYNSVRNTSLYLLAFIVLRFLPIKILTAILARAFRAAQKGIGRPVRASF